MIEAVLFVSLSVVTPAAATPVALTPAIATPATAMQQDPRAQLAREARRAAYRYESLLRRRAPSGYGGGAGTRCDEVIGRFCFRFTENSPSAPPDTLPEHPDIVRARDRAIQAHRAWLSAEPGHPEAAGAVVRYLVEADRASEAVPLARTHVWAAERRPASLLTLGLALHEAGSFAAAEAVFDSARAALPPSERRRLDHVGVLLEPGERGRYGDLSPERREAYDRRFWRLSDPSFLEPGNERRSAHYARHAWAAILEAAPHAAGRVSWGGDTEEIVLRYGLPTRRERIRDPSWLMSTELSMLEIFDPHGVSFVPAAMETEGLPWEPEPGETAPLERTVARSSYTPVRLHRTRSLSVQASRFPTAGGAAFTVSARLEGDTAWAPPVSPEGLVVVMDTLGREAVRAPADVRVAADSVTWVTGGVELEPGAWVYRVEVTDDSTGQAGLAQYRIDVDVPGRPTLSDLMVAAPEDPIPASRAELRALGTLLLPTDVSVLIWAEAVGLSRSVGESRYAVEWWVESAEPGTVLGRAVRWLGRRIGLVGDRDPLRVRWEAGSAETPVPVAFVVDFDGLDAGLYRLGLSVEDLVSGGSATVTRLVRLDPGAPPPYPPAPD